MKRLGIAPGAVPEAFSVCKLVDIRQGSITYLSTFAYVYSLVSRRVSIIEVLMERKTTKYVKLKFCGRGPAEFQEVLDYSADLMEKSDGSTRLVCREGIETLEEVLDFITGHLWDEGVEPPEAMGAVEDVGEIVLRCFQKAR